MFRSPTDVLRNREDPQSGRVAFVELFYDLVFVFAITQISHLLLHHYTPVGAVEAGLLLLAAWWVWIYTTWALNWLDPRAIPVRLMLYVSMLLGLFMSMSVPEAFGDRGLSFALAYAAMQLGRTLFMLWCLGGARPAYATFQRMSLWMTASGLLWVLGGLVPGEARLAIWLVALGIEYTGPWATYWVPRMGRSVTTDWDVHGGHIAERCGLFVIICLGETLLVSGATFAGQEWTQPGVLAFLANFVGTVAMWWVYFHIGHERGTHMIEHSDDPGRIARIAFTYAHLPIVAGIVLSAVAGELVIAHPEGAVEPDVAASILGGPALFLVGNAWFKKLTGRWVPLSHLVGLAALAGLVYVMPRLSPLELNALANGTLVVVAIWERLSLGAAGGRTVGTGD